MIAFVYRPVASESSAVRPLPRRESAARGLACSRRRLVPSPVCPCSHLQGRQSWRGAEVSGVFGCSAVLHVAAGARDERWEVESVGRSGSLLVGLETVRCTLDEPRGPDGVSARLVRQSHAQLGQALPQLAFLFRARLPPDLEGFVRSEGASIVEQTSGVSQGPCWRTRFFGDGLDAPLAVRQGSSERVARSRLLCSPLLVSIAITDHVRPPSQPSAAPRREHSNHMWPSRVAAHTGERQRLRHRRPFKLSSCPRKARTLLPPYGLRSPPGTTRSRGISD